ncbi:MULTISPECIES: HTH-type transcriptional regulator CysB [Sedimenticola]|uniref:HTH-type transcriptional regulator CysB n=1 Tax=Sedimenticola selenatireducens TaxID=191960 RepID=A0A2N6CTJ8_9GAMM|nr:MULTISPECIES: HTH-type transcriptional regulator CysB [Sedimenticola]MCW8903720.1 HTH-type transcriptional regulator CysB [Sedimenticola sp.]PLX60497.1 MAG: HTH-type transcriptional regulator CysB [Sedimenticola selenatireducens]
MKLQQLRFLLAVAQNDLNITAAAERLFTSQPGISKQIRLLEEELGVTIFERTGRQLTGITDAGKAIISRAEAVLREVDSIRDVASEFSDPRAGSLSIATTHTQARYVLPPVIKAFRARYPQVDLQMHQGNPEQISEMAAGGGVDFAIATEATVDFGNLIMMPCYHWNRTIITPCDHPLRDVDPLTLEAVAEYPIVTYVFGFTGRSQLDKAFRRHDLEPNVVFTATDADVIKTYVRLGIGIGILAKMAYSPEQDKDLCSLDATHLFPPSTTRLGFRPGLFLRAYHYDFIELFASHLTRELVDNAVEAASEQERNALFTDLVLQEY